MFIAVCTLGVSLLPLGFDQVRLWAFSGLLAVIALAHLRTEAPAVHSPLNHIGLACVWGSIGIGMYAYAPHSVMVLVPAMFVGTVPAVRLVERGQIAAHWVFATAAMLAPVLLGIVDRDTMIAVASVIPAIWVLGVFTVFVLEVAEAQGEELEQLVRRDPLTGVGNRRMLTEELADELERHVRVRRPLTVMALDLDGFKAINDEIGHGAGDDLLREVAGALLHVTGDGGTVVRTGGDEFCVILPLTSPDDAERVGNAIRAQLATLPLPSGRVTTGIGIASYPRDAVHSGVLLHVADERLLEYKAARATSASATAAKSKRDEDGGSPLYRHA